MAAPWQWYTRWHDNAAAFAMLFNGQNTEAVARIPQVKFEADMFAGIRFYTPPDNIPQFASSGDYITWTQGLHIRMEPRLIPSCSQGREAGGPEARG
jgi:hypothetical protein